MRTSSSYVNSVPFNRRLRRRIPYRLLWVLGISGVLVGIWWWVPPAVAQWFLLAGVVLLAWLSTYGWRAGLKAVHTLVDRLEHLEA